MSLDSAAAKQNALQHVLNALRITLAREIVLAALMLPSGDGMELKIVFFVFITILCISIITSFLFTLIKYLSHWEGNDPNKNNY